ncbi:deoxyribose-phosphate aldolase [Microbacterium sp. 22195]|uniref:deoxyribose-phosphate aldolase n=1 Tax=Microbacterium sp. 22195 TaxID=3453891 RepID=UPI003F86C313
MTAPSATDLARHIQHTLIATGVTRDQMIAHAHEAVSHGFAAAMVPGSWVDVVAHELAGTDVQVASALDFPTVGVMTTAGKAREAEELVRLGAQQIDMGVQIGWLKSGDRKRFAEDIRAVVGAGVPVKVMLELPLLTVDEREFAVELSIQAGAAYLKNASSGAVEIANPESIRFLAERVPEGVGVKASGGITSAEQARALLDAGAQLLGTSAGIEIVTSGAGERSY